MRTGMAETRFLRPAQAMKLAWGRWGWGFIDQGFSSVSNLGLTLLAARLLGPRGLGIVAIGFALYLVALGFQQTLISQPLVISTSTFAPSERSRATGCSLTATIVLGLTAALGFAQVRTPLIDPASAWRWWSSDAWPMGRWFAGDGAIYMIGGQVILFAMVALVGTAAIGGYRAAMTIFGPLTLLRPAVALP